jgi:hypothetical protein
VSTNRDTSAHDTYWRLRTLPSRSVPGCPANEHTYRNASAALTVGAGISGSRIWPGWILPSSCDSKFRRFVGWTFVPSVFSFGCVRSGDALSSSIRR